jgi:hypothetical protein
LDSSPDIPPALLPAAGSNNLSKDQKFTSVGAGTGEAVNGPGGNTFPIDDVRHVAVGTLSVTKSWLRISQNGSHGDGGTCFADSGGPGRFGGREALHGREIVPIKHPLTGRNYGQLRMRRLGT